METNTTDHPTPTKSAMSTGFAIVGFGALILAGIALIIYGAHYIPQTLSRLAGAVYLSPDASGTLATTTETTTTTVTPSTPVVTQTPAVVATTTVPAATTAPAPARTGGGYQYTYPTIVPATYSGRPDLSVQILDVGYLQTSSASSFRSSNSIDENDRPAIRFRVKNTGTNLVSSWQVEVQYPANSGDDTYLINSSETLRPNGYKDFTFGFDNPDTGNNREFVVSADPNNRVSESNEGNNRDSATIDIGENGSSNNNNDDISCDLSVSPSRIDDDESATLRWDTDGDVREAEINHGVGSVDEDGGSERVSPNEDTTYRLTIRDRDDNEATCSVTVRVN